MNELKKSANWNIAATHYLTAGFAIPFLIHLVSGIFISSLRITSPSIVSFIGLLISALSIWLGVMYSVKYLKKTYLITENNKIVMLSTIYFVVLGLGYLLFYCITLGLTSNLLFAFVTFVVEAALFYFASKKYLQNTSSGN
jgi:hypothetical protein